MSPDPTLTALCSTRVTVPIWRAVRQAAIEQGRTIQVVVEEALTSWLARQGVTGVVLADPVEKKRIEDIVIQTLADRQIQRKYGPRHAYPQRRSPADLAAPRASVAPGTTVDVRGIGHRDAAQGGSDGDDLGVAHQRVIGAILAGSSGHVLPEDSATLGDPCLDVGAVAGVQRSEPAETASDPTEGADQGTVAPSAARAPDSGSPAHVVNIQRDHDGHAVVVVDVTKEDHAARGSGDEDLF